MKVSVWSVPGESVCASMHKAAFLTVDYKARKK